MVVSIFMVSIDKQKLQVLANAFAILIFALLLAFPWTFSRPVSSTVDAPERYRVYGISYGKSSYQEDKIIHGGSSSKAIPFEWLFWIIKGNGRTILVDTGFDDAQMADVVLTHAHWDQIGSLAPYK